MVLCVLVVRDRYIFFFLVYIVYGYYFLFVGGIVVVGEFCVVVVMFRVEINVCEEKIKNLLVKIFINKFL